MARILVSDDNRQLLEIYRIGLSKMGHTICTACNGDEAYHLFLDLLPDVLITDQHMPLMCGLDLILALRKQGFTTPVILISGGRTHLHGTLDEIVILNKPVSYKKLSLLIRALLS